MRYNDIKDLLKAQPFRPFRFVLADGSSYEVKHPEFCLPTLGAVHIGIPEKGKDDPAVDHVAIVSLYHIVKTEYLTPSAPSEPPFGPTSNGTQTS
jgi:hypothetical protein